MKERNNRRTIGRKNKYVPLIKRLHLSVGKKKLPCETSNLSESVKTGLRVELKIELVSLHTVPVFL